MQINLSFLATRVKTQFGQFWANTRCRNSDATLIHLQQQSKQIDTTVSEQMCKIKQSNKNGENRDRLQNQLGKNERKNWFPSTPFWRLHGSHQA